MIDFKTIPPNTCIYCESEGEWNELCDKLESSGYHWGGADLWESNERPGYAAEDSWNPVIVNFADLAQSQMQISIDSISSFL